MERSKANAKGVWEIFEAISSLPHGSGNEAGVRQWVADFAEKHGLKSRTDATGNIIVDVPASTGREGAETVVLQGHLDMVCQKDSGSEHDFETDGIKLVEKDGWVYGDGTTLGADNGVGVAMALAAAVDESVSHPKMELLFTVDEETGLTGATGLKPGFFTGKTLLNLDSEDDSFTVGCAGGEQTEIHFPIVWDEPSGFSCYELAVANLRGGHSGVDVHKQRANALKLLGRCLAGVDEVCKVRVAEVTGGSAHNAIPREAKAMVCLQKPDLEAAMEAIERLGGIFRNEFAGTDPDITVTLEARECKCEGGGCKAMSEGCSERLIALLAGLPCGVNRVSHEFEGVVETSNNVAVITTDADKGEVVIVTSQRSLKETCLDMLTGVVRATGKLAGAEVGGILIRRVRCWRSVRRFMSSCGGGSRRCW